MDGDGVKRIKDLRSDIEDLEERIYLQSLFHRRFLDGKFFGFGLLSAQCHDESHEDEDGGNAIGDRIAVTLGEEATD